MDIYGDCGERKCRKDSDQCFKDIEKNYKFYLSFENSFCTEYITEKFWQILGKWWNKNIIEMYLCVFNICSFITELEVVPVVYGKCRIFLK